MRIRVLYIRGRSDTKQLVRAAVAGPLVQLGAITSSATGNIQTSIAGGITELVEAGARLLDIPELIGPLVTRKVVDGEAVSTIAIRNIHTFAVPQRPDHEEILVRRARRKDPSLIAF